MSLAALAATICMGIQAPLDRSGEPALKLILGWAKGLDNAHVVILKTYRDTTGAPIYPDLRIDLWLSGPKFRYETSGYWGDAQFVASDGATVINDPQSEYEPAVVADAKGSALATLADLKLGPDEMTPFFTLMNGPEQLDKLVEKTAAIKLEAVGSGEKMVLFTNKKLGNVHLSYHELRGGVQLDRIDYDNMPFLQEQHDKNPEDYDAPDPGILYRHDIIVEFRKPDDSIFQPKAAKGREVVDKRAKKKG
jgi:hypothetical protein